MILLEIIYEPFEVLFEVLLEDLTSVSALCYALRRQGQVAKFCSQLFGDNIDVGRLKFRWQYIRTITLLLNISSTL